MFDFKFSCHFPKKELKNYFLLKKINSHVLNIFYFVESFFAHTHYQHLIQDYELPGLRSLNKLCYDLLSKVDCM